MFTGFLVGWAPLSNLDYFQEALRSDEGGFRDKANASNSSKKWIIRKVLIWVNMVDDMRPFQQFYESWRHPR